MTLFLSAVILLEFFKYLFSLILLFNVQGASGNIQNSSDSMLEGKQALPAPDEASLWTVEQTMAWLRSNSVPANVLESFQSNHNFKNTLANR
jgi:hypothetical protein